jgi:UDP-N-acetyl-D-glucosamine dehydrogenase
MPVVLVIERFLPMPTTTLPHQVTPLQQALQQKIAAKTARIAIVGLGYVGLPLAQAFGQAGFRVTGYDTQTHKVATLNHGQSTVQDVPDAVMADLVASQHFVATTNASLLATADVLILCVPTPLTRNRTPDMGYIESAVASVTEHLTPGQLIVLESTTYPGSTDELVLPKLQTSGLIVGESFFLAYSPERVDPGNPTFGVHNTPKIVGGTTPACLDLASALYQHVVQTVVPVSSTRAAELVKVFENTFRAVNIGLVNELALVCDKLNLNVWEVVDAAATKPFGMMRFTPGPGIGGHCIPVDPFYLTWKVRELGFQTRFIELAGEMNNLMPHFVREKLMRALGESFRSLNGSSVLVLGVAYKPDVADWRESPAQFVLDILAQDGVLLTIHDPYIDTFEDHSGRIYHNAPLTEQAVKDADAVLILTHHHAIDYDWLVDHAQVVVDTRNATAGVANGREKIRLL